MKSFSQQTIRGAVQKRSEEIIEWAKALISLASENRPPKGKEAVAQQFIAEECRKLELEVDIFSPEEVPEITNHPHWLAGRNYQNNRKNVVARWAGKGAGKSVLFSGHADVAPFEPDDWKICRPYEPVVKDGKLYGRGAADMKGGLAAAFWGLRILRDLGFEPEGNILFESVVDEEFAGGNGTLSARLRGYNADLAVVPEPTQMQICTACFGALLGDLTIIGQAGMPYTGAEIPNPVSGAGRAIELLAKWQQQWRDQNSHPLFQGPGQELKALIWRIDSTREGEFTQLGTPLQVRLSWVIWCHPGMTEEEFFNRFQAFWKEQSASDPALKPFDLRLERTHHFVKPWETPRNDSGVRAVAAALESAGQSTVIAGAPFSCDLAIYGEVGKMPCVLLGPRCGNLHAPDEWTEIEDILNLTVTFAQLVSSWCA